MKKETAMREIDDLDFYLQNHTDDYSEESHTAMMMAKEALKENKGEWIPVSKKLPEDGEWALFTDGKVISVERFKLDAENHFFPSGRWFELDKAIAWMPLPEPYKEGGDT